VQPGNGHADSGLIQVGDSRGWVHVSAGSDHYFGLKTDGTLWEWRYRFVRAGASEQKVQAPAQLGTDTDWIAVASCGQGNVAIKADGTIWRWGEFAAWSRSGGFERETIAHPQQWLACPGKQRPVSVSYDGPGVAVVCADGSLWVGGRLPYGLLSQKLAETASAEMIRFGEETDWKHVELVGGLTVVGVKRDGSMWTWETGGLYGHRQNSLPLLVPLSEYTLWVSVCGYGRASLALGRDGTLCLWGDPEFDPNQDPTGRYSTRLLLPSRIHAVQVADLSPR
jgi:alpha-tubulin suppressor-like RCC1 family protein